MTLWCYSNVSNVTLVGSLSSLRRLVVSAPVMSLPAHWLAGAARLEELHLSGRHLASLPADALRGAYSLRDVTITRTVLRALPPDLLHDNTGLRRLALTHSSLQALPELVPFCIHFSYSYPSRSGSSLPFGERT